MLYTFDHNFKKQKRQKQIYFTKFTNVCYLREVSEVVSDCLNKRVQSVHLRW